MKKSYLLLFSLFTLVLYSQSKEYDVFRHGNLEALETLYSNNPEIIHSKNNSGFTPLILACYNGNIVAVQFLLDKLDDIDGSSEYGTPLMAATVKGELEIVKLLLSKGANPNITDAKGTSALHYAVMFQNIDMIKQLVNAKAEAHIKNSSGQTALDFAIMLKNEDILNLLKEK